MKTLSLAGQQKAQAYIEAQARPLERSLYAYHFRSGSREAVLAELTRFQNPDGGFGHGLEPDLRLPDSAAITTTVALQSLRELGAGSDHPLVRGAIRYLLGIYDAAHRAWPIIPPNVDDAPHAPWWTYKADLTLHLSNPRPEIVGYCYDYADQVPDRLHEQLIEPVVAHFESQPDRWDAHDDLLCYVRLAETRTLPEAIRSRLLRKLERALAASVSRDPAAWSTYVMQPLKAVSTPDSPFVGMLAAAIDLNLDYVIERQGADGAWMPVWTWGTLYPEVWPVAEREWKGILTLNTLRTLRAFGRLE